MSNKPSINFLSTSMCDRLDVNPRAREVKQMNEFLADPKTSNFAASMPVQQQKSAIELSTPLDIEDLPSSSLPAIAIAFRHKHATALSESKRTHSASTTARELSADAKNKPPRRKRKRSASPLPTPKSPQITTQPGPRGRAQIRAASSPTVVITPEYVPPSRISARLARKAHPFIRNRSSDIYTHLADPNVTGHLPSKPPVGSIMLTTPSMESVSHSKLVKKPKGRPKKFVDLADEKTKEALMEEWARMRRSQGALLEKGEQDRGTGAKQTYGSQENERFALSGQAEAETQRHSLDPEVSGNQVTTTNKNAQVRETLVNVSTGRRLSTQPDFGNVESCKPSPLVRPKSPYLPSGGGDEQPILPESDIQPLSITISNPHVHTSPTGGRISAPELLWEETTPRHSVLLCECTGPSLFVPSVPPSPEDYTNGRPAKSPGETQAEATNLEHRRHDSPVTPFPPTRAVTDSNGPNFDYEEEFRMLEVPEILTLPWEPVASHIYVPPALGHLIAGMKRQLNAEAQARRRAEELYQAELRRRVRAEQIIRGLCTERERQVVLPGGQSARDPVSRSRAGASLLSSCVA
ncbi:hypothetical protein PAXRUDRAFT_11475 [Paxillus rubicundulus Ve08.2h10]|uniref:Uncharacterized protein n=1 Tax=Paxillus rubicundulus Ve08.2h10 TaxID=930991 RepID=A0A0D0E3E7_9AGAM|nr:hypothetical protein PAXRUDRAFT_11475 [Paxillus rubicundulus Ve08.2h10]